MQTTWLRSTTVSSRVALLLRSAEHAWHLSISPPITRLGPFPGPQSGDWAALPLLQGRPALGEFSCLLAGQYLLPAASILFGQVRSWSTNRLAKMREKSSSWATKAPAAEKLSIEGMLLFGESNSTSDALDVLQGSRSFVSRGVWQLILGLSFLGALRKAWIKIKPRGAFHP